MITKAELFADDLIRLSTWAKALSHPARLEILNVLANEETCICGELVDALPLSQASVSRHLQTLKDAGLIKGEVDGPRSCYCVDRGALKDLREHFGVFIGTVLESSSGSVRC